MAPDRRRVAVGVGVASAATAGEVADLVARALGLAGLSPADVAVVGTADHRRSHPAVTSLGWPVEGFSPAALSAVAEDRPTPPGASGPVVAEPAALLAAGEGGRLVVPKQRSAHATVAVAVGAGRPAVPEGRERRVLSTAGGAFSTAARRIAPPDPVARREARELHLRLTKPPGSLGRLEAFGAQLAAIAGEVPPPLPRPAALAVFAGDHGVHAQGVSPWPQEVTGQMVANFLAGGAAVNVLARQHGIDVAVVDVGVAHPIPVAGVVDRNVRRGTRDLSRGPAMSLDEASRALDVGAELAAELVAAGARCLLTGDMGIANTTPSAALVAAFTGRPAAEVTGRGTGIDDDTLARKSELVAAAVARVDPSDPLAVLAEVGGLEIAALAGFVVGGAAAGLPVVIDGLIAGAGTLVAARLAPECLPYVVAGHRSVEPGAAATLDHLGLDPLIDLDLRLGEGTGACLALPLLESAARVLAEMATFDGAGVTEKAAGGDGEQGAGSGPRGS